MSAGVCPLRGFDEIGIYDTVSDFIGGGIFLRPNFKQGESGGDVIAQFDNTELNKALALAEKQACIRAWLKQSEYSAFIANGSILPRYKGTDLLNA